MTYNTYQSYSRVPRTWLIFSQILGTIVSVIGLAMYIYHIQDIYHAIPGDDLTQKSVTALLLAIISYFVWKSIYTAYIIINLAKKSSDAELCANRYIISALSLGVGGFFTPFLVTSFPNVTTTSTIKPRYFLSKVMGLCTLIGAPIFAISYFLTLITGINGLTNLKLIFDPNSAIRVISILVLTISALFFAFGLITTVLFSQKQTANTFEQNNVTKLTKTISTIWMSIITLELVIVILLSIVRLIGALYDLIRIRERGAGIFMFFFALINLFITMSYVAMVIYITSRTITGLWSIDGTVTIKKYEHNKYAQKRLTANTNNNA